jgi:soluble lytic murein transglycosylase
VVLLAEYADKIDKPHFSLNVAKEGLRRGLDVGAAAFPTKAIPASAKYPAGLDKAIVYAIARQESTFNTGAISPAGARGLLQLMPATAKSLSRKLGVSYSQNKLISDPAYNVTLGAQFLSDMLGRFDGSYILAFAAYNAGPGRSVEWIRRFGDPRDPRVDAVDWVEMIPFTETRNYVQRVMENMQAYRERLGTGPLAIEADLNRGRAG